MQQCLDNTDYWSTLCTIHCQKLHFWKSAAESKATSLKKASYEYDYGVSNEKASTGNWNIQHDSK